ncbi:uncharacterized protein K460DRAFT_376610 [Cucurbitaria berberidis CBS 394.84]|uniref:Uncharacterized protein n=1 Tax=Cucurbitaria berberidis CBS 394.84 TaxID=1168544 RepID=A0A9P4L7M2_9PLEO|nr:uncharacterized protein K460DRAFT_376610 [Cucurbitaria berberidis CBS 394.84]KAF1845120.1 hypothetical protein K460DRAFT_376610 [Cucurbitaria berberidis CBS 394.84]
MAPPESRVPHVHSGTRDGHLTTPLQPCSSTSITEEDASLEFTQRIERKLAAYNASENAFKRWLFEILSWLISAFCMVSIIGIYIRINGRKTIESEALLTLTNFLGKIASAALIVPTSEALGQLKWNWFHNSKAMWDFEIFDKASRGPLGAMMLLFRTKGRSLAALGALLIVLLLAIDTFFQQVMVSSAEWWLVDMGTVPKIRRYSPRMSTEYRAGIELLQFNEDIATIASKFFYDNGTQPIRFGNGTRADIPINCPTSNCTWPIYETLGVCSACQDVSEMLWFGCISTRIDWIANLTGTGTESTYPNGTSCGYFINSSSEYPILMSGYRLKSSDLSPGEALLTRTLPLITNPDRQPLFGGSINYKDIRNPIIDAIIVGASDGIGGVYRNETPTAHECVLSWCVKSIKSSYSWGGYSEEVTGSITNTTAGPYPWTTRFIESTAVNGTDIYYSENINIVPGSIDDTALSYGVSNKTMSETVAVFDDVFPSFVTAHNATEEPLMRNKFYTAKKGPITRRLLYNPWQPPNDVSQHLSRLAIAITNLMRSSSVSSESVAGQAWERQVFVRVRWEWLTFPLLLLTLSLVFLVLTIVKTSGDAGIGLWKTSAMPTLIYSLPKETQSQLASPSTWNSTQGGGKKVRIRLLPNIGWRVSGHNQLSASPKLPLASKAPRGWI